MKFEQMKKYVYESRMMRKKKVERGGKVHFYMIVCMKVSKFNNLVQFTSQKEMFYLFIYCYICVNLRLFFTAHFEIKKQSNLQIIRNLLQFLFFIW